MSTDTYLLWHTGHQAWWRTNSAGYTDDVWTAGRHTHAEAERECGRWENERPLTVMVTAPESDQKTFSVGEIRRMVEVMQGRVMDAESLALAERAAERGCPTADEWNTQHPVGTPVVAYPGTRYGRAICGITRSLAWNLGEATPVVLVVGLSGGIALTHVDVVRQESNA